MKRWALPLTALSLVAAGAAGTAYAETTSPSPSPTSPSPSSSSASPSPSASAAADPFVRDFDGQVRDITFPEANLDGSVTETGAEIMLKADVFFAYRKADLNAKGAAALDRAAQRLKDLGATKVRVAGYTDSKGSKSYNLRLATRRAEAVRSGLAARLPGLSYAVKGYGESRPVANSSTESGRALNRRVTITVTG